MNNYAAENKVIVVVPTIREEQIKEFLNKWKNELKYCSIIIVEDNPTKCFHLDQSNIIHYTWKEIDEELSDKAWIIPRRTDCIRSFGFYKAYQQNPKFVITLDDDCYPHRHGFVMEHARRLSECDMNAWISTGDGMLKPRGVPYYNSQRTTKECMLNHGLWTKNIDYDAPTQLVDGRLVGQTNKFTPIEQTIPYLSYFPMCGMNIAFKPEIIPAFYFLLMGKDYPFDRFGDIWSGIIIKKICDHLGCVINSGSPYIVHEKASNVFVNLKKEVEGIAVNEQFWGWIDEIELSEKTFKTCYQQIAKELSKQNGYWKKLSEAMLEWTRLFKLIRE